MTTIDAGLRNALTGISGILVTPFDSNDEVAPLRLKPIVDRAIQRAFTSWSRTVIRENFMD